MTRLQIVGILSAIVSLSALPTVAPAQVKVVKAPAVIERKTYDPNNRPTDAPPVRGNEDGVVSAKFVVTTIPGFTPGTTKEEKENNRWSANIRTQQLEVRISLKIEIWTPEGLAEKPKAHIEGHRQIVEDIYKTADKTAMKLGQTYVGRGSTGTGDNAQEAQKAAVKTLMEHFAEEYMAATEKRADRVHDIYDDLTGQGTKDEPKEPDAIKQAFAQQAKEDAEAKKAEKKTSKK